MNKKLTFLLALTFLFLFSGSVFGQEEVKKEYWENGKLRSETHYKNGKKDGLTTLCSEDGRTGELEYKNGKLNGLKTTWYEHDSTRKRSRTRYKNGKKDGMAVEWYPSGRKKSTSHYKNDIENGFRKEWDKSGKLIYQGNFVDGNEVIE